MVCDKLFTQLLLRATGSYSCLDIVVVLKPASLLKSLLADCFITGIGPCVVATASSAAKAKMPVREATSAKQLCASNRSTPCQRELKYGCLPCNVSNKAMSFNYDFAVLRRFVCIAAFVRLLY